MIVSMKTAKKTATAMNLTNVSPDRFRNDRVFIRRISVVFTEISLCIRRCSVGTVTDPQLKLRDEGTIWKVDSEIHRAEEKKHSGISSAV